MSETPPPTYLDYAAATPLDPRVRQAMAPFESDQFYNPSARYEAARSVGRLLDDARATVAAALGAKSTEIIFTAGATESINLAVLGVARSFPVGQVLAAATEHESVLACLASLKHAALIPVDEQGRVTPAALAAAIGPRTVLVSVAYANSEIGTIQPLAELAAVIRRVRAQRAEQGSDLPLYLHTDASAAAGSLDLQVSRLGVDLLTLNTGKLYGPKQSGALYVRSGTALAPLIYGGGQERGLRSGTPSLAAAVGLAAALELAVGEREHENTRLVALRNQLLKQIKKSNPDIILNGPGAKRLAGNINLTIPGAEGETLVLYLENAGFLVATGSACQASDTRPSHVLRALGRSDIQASQSLRITLGRTTTPQDLDRLAAVLPAIIERVRQLS